MLMSSATDQFKRANAWHHAYCINISQKTKQDQKNNKHNKPQKENNH